jgi:hypothetical protein
VLSLTIVPTYDRGFPAALDCLESFESGWRAVSGGKVGGVVCGPAPGEELLGGASIWANAAEDVSMAKKARLNKGGKKSCRIQLRAVSPGSRLALLLGELIAHPVTKFLHLI